MGTSISSIACVDAHLKTREFVDAGRRAAGDFGRDFVVSGSRRAPTWDPYHEVPSDLPSFYVDARRRTSAGVG